MSITESQAQTDIPARLRATIARLNRRLRTTAAGRAAGLTPTRISLLHSIDRLGPIRLSELAAEEAINPTMLSRIVADLAAGGLIERVGDPTDRRAALVTTTREGRRVIARMRRERTDALSVALETLAEPERQVLERALPALEQLADNLKGRRP